MVEVESAAQQGEQAETGALPRQHRGAPSRTITPSLDTGAWGELPGLIALDLDGTLLSPTSEIPQRSQAAINAARAAGAEVVLVTGRSPWALERLVVGAARELEIVCSNGAVVWQAQQQQVLEVSPLSGPALAEIAGRLRELPGVALAADDLRGELHIEAEFATARLRTTNTWAQARVEALPGGVSKLIATHPRMGVGEFHDLIEAVVGEMCTITPTSSSAWLELSAPGIDKASGLARLSSKLGVAQEKVAAFGDMLNDESMLAWAGRAIAMGNAHERIRRMCPLRAPSHHHEGVAVILEHWVRAAETG